MAKTEKMIEEMKGIVNDKERIRNMCIAAHIDHGKTTLSDSLLAGAGMISEELAGTVLATDFDKQEQERGITIYAANVSMVHEYDGKKFLINLIDTPGHVDFGGDVTRAMRATDGCLVLVDAVDGVMPQTETVLRQALKERVKPILFINKVDRLIKELKLNPDAMQQRFVRIIGKVNDLIYKNAPPEFKKEWQVDVNSGKVGFGSAYKKWAISIPFMNASGLTFKDIIDMTTEGKEKELSKKAPVHKIILDMIIKHLPTPAKAQPYRIPKIWTGEIESEEGQDMIKCNSAGGLAGVVTNVGIDKHAGLVACVRLFAGTVHDGDEVFLVGRNEVARVQQVAVYEGSRRAPIEVIPCGNIVALAGLADASTGETVCSPNKIIAPFESIKHLFEPVVTKSIEVVNVKDLPKVIALLKQRGREDPTILVKISEATGEMLVSGLGELHIDAKIERYIRDRGFEIKSSPPIVIYKEGIQDNSPEIEGKSPNKHNHFFIKVEPLDKKITDYLAGGELREGKIRKKDEKEVTDSLVSLGLDREEAKKVFHIYKGNIFVNATRGVQYLNEVMELMRQGFEEVVDKGPLADESTMGLKVLIVDAKLHDDAIHRGPAQVLPAIRGSIKEGMMRAEAAIMEPKQVIRIDCPTDTMGAVMNEVQNRRGQVMNMEEEGDMVVLSCKIPVAEMFGFEAALKSATGGRGFQSLIDVFYEFLPKDLQEKVISNIRKRKGMKDEIPKAGSFIEG